MVIFNILVYGSRDSSDMSYWMVPCFDIDIYIIIPPATKLGGGILESPCLSVRLSVDARG